MLAAGKRPFQCLSDVKIRNEITVNKRKDKTLKRIIVTKKLIKPPSLNKIDT